MVIFLLSCASTAPTTPDTGDAPDTADSGPSADSADTGTGGDSADTAVDPAEMDADGDGYTPNEGDCDDTRPNVYPGAPDYCDGLDADCDGEPIPDGSCGTKGDASVQWSWWIQSGDLDVRQVTPAEVAGDGSLDLIAYGLFVSPEEIVADSLPLSERRAVSTWPAASWTDGWPALSASGMLVGDGDGDGLDDLWTMTGSDLGFQGGVFLIPGSRDGFPTEPLRYDEGAQAYWLDGDGLELDQFPDASVGDPTGNGLADVLVRTVDGAHDHLTLVPGEPDVAGEHGFSELPSMWTDEDETDAISAALVGDLDGDGRSDLMFIPSHAGIDGYVLYMSGPDWVDGGHAPDAAVALTAGEPTDGDSLYGPAGTGVADLDHDGLDDALLSRTEPSGGYCTTILSGGLPAGDVAAWTFAQVCGGVEAAPESWTGDLDQDGANDIATITGYLIPSAPLAAGGTFDIADLRTLRYDSSGFGLEDIADLDGDGRPEWIFTENVEGGETYILAGFEIPWDDASKW